MSSTNDIAVVLRDRTDHIAVWGTSEDDKAERPFDTYEEAHAFIMQRKAEGFEIACVEERPISAIEDAADAEPQRVPWLRRLLRLPAVGVDSHVRVKGVRPTSPEYDEGKVISIDGDRARVRWTLAKATYTEDVTMLELIGGDHA